MRIKLNCLACGHLLELGEAYEDYEGEVRCWGCRTVLEIALREGKLRSMRRSSSGAPGRDVESANPLAAPPDSDPRPTASGQETR
jgi:hypothetical protein